MSVEVLKSLIQRIIADNRPIIESTALGEFYARMESYAELEQAATVLNLTKFNQQISQLLEYNDINTIKIKFEQLLQTHWELTQGTALNLLENPDDICYQALKNIARELYPDIADNESELNFKLISGVNPETNQPWGIQKIQEFEIKAERDERIGKTTTIIFLNQRDITPADTAKFVLEGVIAHKDMIFDANQIVKLPSIKRSRMRVTALNEMEEQYPELYQKLHDYNGLSATILDQTKKSLTPKEGLLYLIQALKISGEKYTGRTYASQHSYAAIGKFLTYLDSLDSETNKQLLKMSSADGSHTLRWVLQSHLGNGGCVELGAGYLESIIANPKNASLLDKSFKNKSQIKNQENLGAPEKRNYTLPLVFQNTILKNIRIISRERLVVLLRNFDANTYEKFETQIRRLIRSSDDLFFVLVQIESSKYSALLQRLELDSDLYWLTVDNISRIYRGLSQSQKNEFITSLAPVLPRLANNFTSMINIWNMLHQINRDDILAGAEFQDQIWRNVKYRHLGLILSSVPLAAQERFCQQAINPIKKILSNTDDLRNAFLSINSAGNNAINDYLKLAGPRIKELINSPEDFRYVTKNVYDKEFMSSLLKLMSEQLNERIKNAGNLRAYYRNCRSSHIEHFNTVMRAKFPEVIKTAEDYYVVYSGLDKYRKKMFRQEMRNHMHNIIQTAEEFRRCLHDYGSGDRQEIIGNIFHKLPDLIHELDDFKSIETKLSPQQNRELVEKIFDKLPDMINSADDLDYLSYFLTEQQLQNLLPKIISKLPGIISEKPEFFYPIISLLPVNQKSQIAWQLNSQLPKMINNERNLAVVISLISDKQHDILEKNIERMVNNFTKDYRERRRQDLNRSYFTRFGSDFLESIKDLSTIEKFFAIKKHAHDDPQSRSADIMREIEKLPEFNIIDEPLEDKNTSPKPS